MASPAAATQPRPLRADARRNRAAILKAARQVFGRQGPDAQMDDVARKAGVGMGTVYRHFPTKEALIDALIADRVEQITAFSTEALEDPDPWHGLRRALWRGAELGARDRALTGMFAERPAQMGAAHSQGRLTENTAELLRRAQAAGSVRPDLVAEDIRMVMCGVMSAMHKTGGPDGWKRHLRLALDGMASGAAGEPLPDA